MDKPYYLVEDEIWAKAYMVYGRSHIPIDTEPIIFADWIDPDGNTLDTYQLKIKDGVAPFSIQTSLDNKVGIYTLRVYSPYQMNFDNDYIFQKEVRLINSAELVKMKGREAKDLSIQFFPEGGYLVDGLRNKLAYRIEGVDTKQEFTGVIKNATGDVISNFKLWNHSLGRVDITPQKAEVYTAELKYKGDTKTVALPARLDRGYSLSAHSQDEDKISVTLSSNMEMGLKGAHLVAHIRGEIVSSFKLESSKRVVVALEKKAMPSGIVHLTLFDSSNQPVAERLIFNRNPQEQIQVDIDVLPFVSQRESVTALFTTSLDSTPVVGSGNISIYNRDILPDEWRSVDIQSYLWLQSDLKGKVDFVADYMAVDDKSSRSFLDLVLATHGWRRFEWQEVLLSRYPELSLFADESTVIKGKVTKLKNERPVKADVALKIVDDDLFAALQVTSGEDGYFEFDGISLSDSVDLFLQAAIHKKRISKKIKKGTQKLAGNRNVEIESLILPKFVLDTFNSLQHFPFSNYQEDEVHQRKVLTQSENRSRVLDNSLWSIDIEEVVVSARRYSAQARNKMVERRYREKGIFFFASTDKFVTDDPQYDGLYFATIHDLLRGMIPGAKKVIRNGTPTIVLGRLSNAQVPRIVIDGYMVPEGEEKLLDPSNVFSLDIVTGIRADALYNVGLVISIITRNPSDPKNYVQPGILNINHPGYHKARAYYTPTLEELESDSDYRTTVYWNPDVKLNSGNHSFSFKTSDLLGMHQIVIEGLTEDGIPFVKRKLFEVVE